MPAHPHAYDDLAQVYAEETNARSRGALIGSDRFNNRRPSLAQVERSPDSERITDHIKPFAGSLSDLLDAVPDAVQRKTSEQARRAGRRGGAANKVRWEKIKADWEQTQAAEATKKDTSR